jgi:hypothetical protein
VKQRRAMSAQLLPIWRAAECDEHPTHFERSRALYDSWHRYARQRHYEPGSPSDFAATMEALGFIRDRLAGERNRIRWGLRLRRLPAPQSPRGGGGEKSSAPPS